MPLTQVSLLRWGEAQPVGVFSPGHHFMLPDAGRQLLPCPPESPWLLHRTAAPPPGSSKLLPSTH